MADPRLIELAALSVFSQRDERGSADQDWRGRHLLVSAGPTLESIDAARQISNRSSGLMGVLLAQAANLRGARVTLVHGPLRVPDAWLEGLECVAIRSAAEMQQALLERQPDADAVAMVAAVADLRRVDGGQRIKPAKRELADALRSGWEVVPDLLQELVKNKPAEQRVLGFAALTGTDAELLERGREKRLQKGCDLLFVNPIDRGGQGFGQDLNSGWLLGDDQPREFPVMPKLALAHRLLDALIGDKTGVQAAISMES